MRHHSSEVPLSNKQVCCLDLCCSRIQVDFQDLTFQLEGREDSGSGVVREPQYHG